MSRFKAVVTDDRHHGDYDRERRILEKIDCSLEVCQCASPSDVIACCSDADAVLVNLAPMTPEVIRSLKNCKVISRYGVGYDNVNVPACTESGIYLTIVDGFCAEDVSDHALALMMSAARQVALRDRQMRAGIWNAPSNKPLHRVSGKVFAYLGFGTIARQLHKKLSGFGISEFLAYSHTNAETLSGFGVNKVSLSEALSRADFISVHLPLCPETVGIINAESFSIMKPSAILINTARGPIIDTPALINALTENRIAACALDVYDSEPLAANSPLRTLENCTLTDHIGWYSEESFDSLKTRAAENTAAVLLGQRPDCIVNIF